MSHVFGYTVMFSTPAGGSIVLAQLPSSDYWLAQTECEAAQFDIVCQYIVSTANGILVFYKSHAFNKMPPCK